jgi:hypothetical protein
MLMIAANIFIYSDHRIANRVPKRIGGMAERRLRHPMESRNGWLRVANMRFRYPQLHDRIQTSRRVDNVLR